MKIFEVGEAAFCIEFGPKIDPDLNQKAIQLAAWLEAQKWLEIGEIVPAYSSITVYFNPLKIKRMSLIEKLRSAAVSPPLEGPSNSQIHKIPVAYGAGFGPDLEAVASLNGITAEEAIRLHTITEFRVYMLGFMPGFPYCGIVPEKIRAPRLESPRTRVPAGSVGIAAAQTGIYPMESPGGWRLIGRTPVTLFDPTAPKDEMFRFKAGDRLRFYSISPEEFREWPH